VKLRTNIISTPETEAASFSLFFRFLFLFVGCGRWRSVLEVKLLTKFDHIYNSSEFLDLLVRFVIAVVRFVLICDIRFYDISKILYQMPLPFSECSFLSFWVLYFFVWFHKDSYTYKLVNIIYRKLMRSV
jgi:hypothetical protein